MGKPTDIAKQALLDAALAIAPFDGWTSSTLRKAEREAGLGDGTMALYFPGGVMEMLSFWAAQLDTQTEATLAKLDLSEMKIRDKVTQGVLARLEGLDVHAEAARRASSRLSLPDGIASGTAQLWAAADTIWRAIGDTSTDGNYYSKRAILSGVIASTLPIWLSDTSEDKAKGRAFLDARIANVMQFEKMKWQIKSKTEGLPNPAEILGSLRYGGGFKRRRRRRSRSI